MGQKRNAAKREFIRVTEFRSIGIITMTCLCVLAYRCIIVRHIIRLRLQFSITVLHTGIRLNQLYLGRDCTPLPSSLLVRNYLRRVTIISIKSIKSEPIKSTFVGASSLETWKYTILHLLLLLHLASALWKREQFLH